MAAKKRGKKVKGKGKGNRCMRQGPVSKNGYLNFLREFSQQPENCKLSPREVFKRAGAMWCNLTPEQQMCYKQMGSKGKTQRSTSRGRSTSKKRSKSRGRSASKKRGCARRSKSKKRSASRSKSTKRSKSRGRGASKKRGCARRSKSAPRGKSGRSKSASRGPSRSKPKMKKPCKKTQSGPVTNNPYLNFVREFRRKVCNLKPQEILKRAGKIWCRMSPEKQKKYRIMACQVTRSANRKCTRLCQEVRRKKLEAAKRKRNKGGKGGKGGKAGKGKKKKC